ncbi:MAG: 4'-phosphopantetheinyl transferase superfamily protein [Betaproteobacteria bacterium]
MLATQHVATADASVRLWLCHLDQGASAPPTIESWLAPLELERASRFGTALLRRRWIVGRAALRQVLGDTLGVPPAAVRMRRGRRGRPELDMPPHHLDFNVSHTDDVALIALGLGLDRDERVGVDIEYRHRKVNADMLARKFLTARERAAHAHLDSDGRRVAFLRLWTCKEAMSKATGDALSAPFADIDITAAPRLLAGPAPYLPDRWRLLVPIVPTDLLAAVAAWKMP